MLMSFSLLSIHHPEILSLRTHQGILGHQMRLRTTIAQSLRRDWSGRARREPSSFCLLSTTSCRNSRLRARLDIPPPFPVTKTCPETTCDCPSTPPMPEGLPIDHEQALNGTMAAYAQQLLVCTGKRDWTSRIENDGEHESWGHLVRGLKQLLGRGGPYLDVCTQDLSLFCRSTLTVRTTLALQQYSSHQYLPCTHRR